MVLVPEWPWLLWNKHPTRTIVLVCPNTHGLIQTICPPWNELFIHILVPSIQHLSHFPKTIPVCWRFVTSVEIHFNIASNHVLDIYSWRRNGAPLNLSTSDKDQKSILSGPTSVAINSQIPIHCKNSPYDSTRCPLAARCSFGFGITTDLMKCLKKNISNTSIMSGTCNCV